MKLFLIYSWGLALALATSAAAVAREVSPAASPPPLVSASAQLTLDEFADVTGGKQRGERFLDKLEGVALFDGTAAGASWFNARADVGLTNGHKVSGDLVGDIQGVDNIEGVRAFRVYNAWLSASGDIGGLEVGVIDLNSQFDIHNVSAPFVNSSFGIGPGLSHSGLNGPSIYPNSGLGVVGWVDDTGRSIRFRAGVFDGVPNDPDRPARTSFALKPSQGALVIGEIDKAWGARNRVVLGAWGYTAPLPRLVTPDRSDHGSVGAYATVEGTLLARADGRRLDGWVRGGVTNPTYNVVSSYVGAGLTYHGLFGKPREDTLGLAIAHADLSRGMEVVDGAVAGASVVGSGTETTIELTYQRRLREWLTIQPDAQFVTSPAGRTDLPDALVLGLRVILGVG